MSENTFGSQGIAFELKRLGLYDSEFGLDVCPVSTREPGAPRRYILYNGMHPAQSTPAPSDKIVGVLAGLKPGVTPLQVIRLVSEAT